MEISTVTNTIKTPTFANNSSPVTDPTTGRQNYFATEEVAPAEQLDGFVPAYSKPTRQTFNTLFRVINKQLVWMKDTFFPKVKADIDTLDSRLGVKTDSASATSDKAHPRIKDLQNRLGQDIDTDTTAFGLANKALGYINTHNHDGGSGTDHAEKVMLTNAAEVQGILPLANIESSLSVSGHSTIECQCYNSLSDPTKDVTISSGTVPCYKHITENHIDRAYVKYYYKNTTTQHSIINTAGTGWKKVSDGGIVHNSVSGFTQKTLNIYVVITTTTQYIVAGESLYQIINGLTGDIYVSQIGAIFANHGAGVLRQYITDGEISTFVCPEFTPLVDFDLNYTTDLRQEIYSNIVGDSTRGACFGKVLVANYNSSYGSAFDISMGTVPTTDPDYLMPTQVSRNDFNVPSTSSKILEFKNMGSTITIKGTNSSSPEYRFKVIIEGFRLSKSRIIR